MTVSSEVPESFKTRWSSNHVDANQPSNTVDPNSTWNSTQNPWPLTRKVNKSCVNCRKSRVKCSGGEPCRRCAGTSTLPACSYTVSQRRGKRKASGYEESEKPFEWQRTLPLDQGIINDAYPDPSRGVVEEASSFSHDQQFEADEFWANIDFPGNDTPVTSAFTPAGIDLTGILESPKASAPSTIPGEKKPDTCPNSCFSSVHSSTNELFSLTSRTFESSFDLILGALDLSISRAAEYLACESCDSGCSRLMTLSLHHQRQLDLISKIAKSGVAHLANVAPPVSFGEYTVSAEDAVSFKKVVLLRVTRNIRVSLDGFQKRAQSFEDQYLEGTLELGEAGQLNLEWLLGVVSSLKRRIDCIKLLLEKPDWETS